MKKFILLIAICLAAISVSAETLTFRTTSYTFKSKSVYGWSDWSPFQLSDMTLTINLDTDIVTIYSPKRQVYKIYEYSGSYVDNDGEQSVVFRFRDQDGDYGTMRLMIRNDGRSEIYIQFANVVWVYTVVRK